jgi:hypothetical protein
MVLTPQPTNKPVVKIPTAISEISFFIKILLIVNLIFLDCSRLNFRLAL